MDREKVIKGLEHCLTIDSPCGDCPYYSYEDIQELECERNLRHDALAMLKEQDGIIPYIDIDEAKCPDCKVKLTRQELLGEDVLFEDFFDYCPHCGRKVKWQ